MCFLPFSYTWKVKKKKKKRPFPSTLPGRFIKLPSFPLGVFWETRKLLLLCVEEEEYSSGEGKKKKRCVEGPRRFFDLGISFDSLLLHKEIDENTILELTISINHSSRYRPQRESGVIQKTNSIYHFRCALKKKN